MRALHRTLSKLKSDHSSRRGTTAVEFAIVAPIAFFVVFGGIELSRISMIRNTAEIAVYEGARAGIVPGATTAQVIAAVNNYLNISGISNATVTVTPNAITNETPQIQVDVDIPISGNTWVVAKLAAGYTVKKSCSLSREWITNF